MVNVERKVQRSSWHITDSQALLHWGFFICGNVLSVQHIATKKKVFIFCFSVGQITWNYLDKEGMVGLQRKFYCDSQQKFWEYKAYDAYLCIFLIVVNSASAALSAATSKLFFHIYLKGFYHLSK